MKNIAIILSIYKTAELNLLSKALESIKNQTYKNIKLFICIDGPVSSNIYELINNFDFNKKIIKNDSALGLAQALNHLIEHVLSDDIFFEYFSGDRQAMNKIGMEKSSLLEHRYDCWRIIK